MTEQFRNMETKETVLAGKNIAVVGASSGLGYSLAEALSYEGANLYLLSRTIQDRNLPFDGTRIPCNLRDSESIKNAFAAIDTSAPQLDILVNCAGIGLTKALHETSYDEIINTLATNLEGVILTSVEAYKRMLEFGSGHIVNVSSTTGIKARDMETIYAASKWGLRGFTESLRMEASKKGIRVTGIYPGGMRTAFWDGSEKDISAYMDPAIVAGQIVHVLKSDASICPSEVVIERS